MSFLHELWQFWLCCIDSGSRLLSGAGLWRAQQSPGPVDRLSEEDCRLAIDLAGIAIWLYDPESRRALWSEKTFQMWGVPDRHEAFPVEEVFALIDVEDRPDVLRAIERCQNQNIPLNCRFRVNRPDGRKVYLHTFAQMIQTRHSSYPRMLGINVDVTKLTELEIAQKQEADYRAQLLNSLPMPIFAKDTSLCYTACNQSFADLLGLHREEIIGKTPADIAPKELASVYMDSDRKMLAKGGSENYECEVRDGFGKPHQFLFHKSCIHDLSGQVTGLVCAMTDLTERNQLEKEASEKEATARALSAMENVLNMVSHDLRTPLSAIRTISEMMRSSESLSWDDLEANLDRIVDQCAKMSSMIEEVLDSARQRNGEATWNWGTVDVTEVIREAVTEQTVVQNNSNVSINCFTSDEKILIQADRTGLQRVIANLLSNAIRFTEEGSILVSAKWTTYRSRQAVEITVTDTGIGIPSDMISRLGEPFVHAKSAGLNDPGIGTGLGLYIVRSIVGAHHGGIEIESEPGSGTEVKVFIPTGLKGPLPPPHLAEISGGHVCRES